VGEILNRDAERARSLRRVKLAATALLVATAARIRTDSSALKAFELVVKTIAGATEFTVRSFGEAKGNGPLVEGRLISWFDVVRTFALIGVAWSGLVLAAGVFAFRRKELAIYSGQGG